MDTSQQLTHYQALIVQYLTEHQNTNSDSEAYQRMMIADRDRHHYQLIATGWPTPSQYVDALLIHLQIKPDGKVWLMENTTELRVAEDLVARGIPKSYIVLAFHPPQYRALSGYAVA